MPPFAPWIWPARISRLLLYATVAAAPLPFGSAHDTTIAFWCIVLGVCAVTASPRLLRRPHQILLGLAALVTLAYALVLHEQLAAAPWFAAPHPLWRGASEALGIALQPSVSIARNKPFYALGSPLVCMLALTCGFVVCADRDSARRLLLVIAWSGGIYAAYGIVAHLIDPTLVLWRDKPAYVTSVTATFINRNTAATYFGSCAVVWLLLLAQLVRRRFRRGEIVWREVSGHLFAQARADLAVAASMLLVCLVAMFMTGSRAGVVLSLLALIVAFTVYFRGDLPRRTGIAAAVLGGGAVALVLLQFIGAGVNARFDAQGAADEGRLQTWRATLAMIADHPWFGTGQGTFASAFPAYRSANVSMWGTWDHAHNTLLELAADMGVPVAAAVVIGWIVILAVLIRGVQAGRRNAIVPIAALSVAILALLHSLVDFSLQIPGYAIVALALVGGGVAQSVGGYDVPNDGKPANALSGTAPQPHDNDKEPSGMPTASRRRRRLRLPIRYAYDR